MDEAGITLRVELRAETPFGPGKAALLQGIRETGSIAASGRRMGMSYKRAWYLIDTLNGGFPRAAGLGQQGRSGRRWGATHADAVTAVLDGYRRMEEAAAAEAVASELAQLIGLLKPDE